jgi:hypothetical protein
MSENINIARLLKNVLESPQGAHYITQLQAPEEEVRLRALAMLMEFVISKIDSQARIQGCVDGITRIPVEDLWSVLQEYANGDGSKFLRV